MSDQCQAILAGGKRCSRSVREGQEYCWQHAPKTCPRCGQPILYGHLQCPNGHYITFQASPSYLAAARPTHPPPTAKPVQTQATSVPPAPPGQPVLNLPASPEREESGFVSGLKRVLYYVIGFAVMGLGPFFLL